MRTKRKQRRSKKSTVDLEQMFEKEVKTSLISERKALSTRNVNTEQTATGTPTRRRSLGLREIATGLEEAKKTMESKFVQTVGTAKPGAKDIHVYESDEETIGHEERNPVEDLVAKQAEALLAAKQVLTQENRELARDNRCLSDQVTYLNEMIDACERQRLELLEQNSALKFENTVLSGTLSRARDRRDKFYAMSPQNLDTDGSFSPSASGREWEADGPPAMPLPVVGQALASLRSLWKFPLRAFDDFHAHDDGGGEAEGDELYQLSDVYKTCIKNVMKSMNL
mmetsp:Transcript_16326/g.33601  ORF Transcript_16326/g.33601 Transcript_16326/m.33601 type:complete len:283 (-) Transcript_16326:2-850(-)